MKLLVLGWLLALSMTAHSATDADRMAEFYKWKVHPKIDPELVRYAGQETFRFAHLIKLTDEHARIMLCMWHRESAYNQKASDAKVVGMRKRSQGIAQTRRSYFTRLRKFWKDRGVELGSFDDPSTQVAFGVAEFKEKLTQSKGDVYDAVRRYNGGGEGASALNKARACEYAYKVFVTRTVVYSDPLPQPRKGTPCSPTRSTL